jgi:hypothetical protein
LGHAFVLTPRSPIQTWHRHRAAAQCKPRSMAEF